MYLRHLLLLSTRTFRLASTPCKTVFLNLPQPRHVSQNYSSSGDSGGDDDDAKPGPKVVSGQKENQGEGQGERPYFSPQENQQNSDGISEEGPKNGDAGAEVELEELSAPTNCCRSGCPNCVWVEYVEKLTERYTNPELSRERILAELETLDDQSIKAFIKLELKCRGLI